MSLYTSRVFDFSAHRILFDPYWGSRYLVTDDNWFSTEPFLVGCSQLKPQSSTVPNPAIILNFEHQFQVLDLVRGVAPPTGDRLQECRLEPEKDSK